MLDQDARELRALLRRIDSRWDGIEQYSKTKRQVKPSRNFVPGRQLETTLFTVVGPGYGDVPGERNWRSVEVLCDPQYGGCGKTIQVAYVLLYQHPRKYSCGCTRRQRSSKDYCGTTHTGYANGRKLTIISFNPKTGFWNYVCECCGEIGELSYPGDGNTALIKLKREANRACPFSPVYFTVYELIDAGKIRRTTELTSKEWVEDDLAAQIKLIYPEAEVIRGELRGEANRVKGARIPRAQTTDLIAFVESRSGKKFKEIAS